MVGQTVGQYHIQEQLEKGGMGIVYKARDSRLDSLEADDVLQAEIRYAREQIDSLLERKLREPG